MAPEEAISPLRIQKSTPNANAASPAPRSNGVSRPLADISPMGIRRNSPSYNQLTKQMSGEKESSPFDSSPYNGRSPHAFWQGRASPSRFSTENMFEREQSPTVAKRPSVEKLKQASRVKNSSMFAREQKNDYDPTNLPIVERPLAANRPLTQYQGNAFNGRGVEGARQENPVSPTLFKNHRRGESQNNIPLFSPVKPISDKSPSPSPRSNASPRNNASPTKSSFANKPNHNTFPRRFDPENSQWSDDDTESKISPPRALRRHAKSVTFDTGPQEIFEYEMVTPDPSSVASGSREGSYDTYDSEDDEISLDLHAENNDDSFDASLEDTDKTPVVLPEDWRHMSPEVAHTEFASTFEDPFGDDEQGRSTPSQQWNSYRTSSVTSDSDPRPLPPVPPFAQNGSRPTSSQSNSSVLERVQAAHAGRSLPTPPRPATTLKSEMLDMKNNDMSLEDRLRLMGLQDNSSPSGSASKEAARLRKHGLGIHVYEDEVDDGESVITTTEVTTTEVVEEYKFPRISRESILRKVKSRTFDHREDEYQMDRMSEERDYANLDPDVAIPSRECSSQFDEVVPDMMIKREEEEEVDLYSIAEMYTADRDYEDFEREGSVIRHDISGSQHDDQDDDASCYSAEAEVEATANQQVSPKSASDDDGPPTPRQIDAAVTDALRLSTGSDGHASLPELSHVDDEDFQSGLGAYLSSSSTPPPLPEKNSPKPEMAPVEKKLDLSSVSEFFRRPETPEQSGLELEEHEDAGTPDSVVHHPFEMHVEDEEERAESPAVPEPVATIKAPGGLKTRVSSTPADVASLAATRRQVSGQIPPPIPDKSPKRVSLSLDPDALHEQDELNTTALDSPTKRRQSFKRLEVTDNSFGDDLSLGLDEEFNRVIEGSKVDLHSLINPSQDPESLDYAFFANMTPRTKKGYLMRQNTKMVIAKRNFSNDSGSTTQDRPSSADANSRSENSSPRKTSHGRSKSWTTEPWNGKPRRKSIRTSTGTTKPSVSGPMPPLPGQESAVSGLGTVVEDQIMSHGEDFELEDGIERGRLFVKVVGVKELDLPLPQNERSYFQLTLDNGLHCVTTSWLELGRSAPIGQEFELVVLPEGLEFQLTLQTKLTPPPRQAAIPPPIPTKSPVKPAAKKSSFSHLLMSPKKRREADRLAKEKQEEEERQRLAAERQRQEQQRLAAKKRAAANPTGWDLLHDIVGDDGSFGRAYVSLQNHEQQCFGRPINVDIPVFNEWALEDSAIASSVKSKRGGNVRRPPYPIGKLQLQLLYIPRPKGAAEEDMPKSMNACVREMKEAEEAEKREYEGFLSQQGGDCPFWRRRFFRLTGTKLTAYHETTRQPRAKIDLAKAAKVIDDKSTLLQPDAGGKSGKGRRKSAFAEEDEGYQFVEEGFRIRFANGETIDFYADSAADKDGWMSVLSRAVGKSAVSGKEWTKAVLGRERQSAQVQAKARDQVTARPQSADGKTADGAERPTEYLRMPKGSQMPQVYPEQGHGRRDGHKSVPVSPVKPMREAPVPITEKVRQAHAERSSPPKNNSSRRKQIQSMIF